MNTGKHEKRPLHAPKGYFRNMRNVIFVNIQGRVGAGAEPIFTTVHEGGGGVC